jgi:hypothetical protein
MKSNKMQFSSSIDRDLLTELKVKVAKEGKYVNEVLEQLARNYVQNNIPKQEHQSNQPNIPEARKPPPQNENLVPQFNKK